VPTVNSEASTAGPRPKRTATPTTAARKIITRLALARIVASGATASVTAPQISALQP